MSHRSPLPPLRRCVAAAALSITLAGAAAAEMIRNCEVSGQKGADHIDPMIPGQLTVRANLSAPAGPVGGMATRPLP
jgi:polar amino acid transport system substrate-binding protein